MMLKNNQASKKFRRTLIGLTAFLLVFTQASVATSVAVHAATTPPSSASVSGVQIGTEFSAGGFKYKVLASSEAASGKTVSLIKGSTTGVVVIPSTVTYQNETFAVTELAENSFRQSNITSVTIPDSVTRIRKGSFAYCAALTTVNLPQGLTVLDEYTFSETTALKTITLPASLTEIGAGAFAGNGLESIQIPQAVTTLGERVFAGCASLSEVSFEADSNLTVISDHAFAQTKALQEVTLPDTVTEIGAWAFSSSGLKSFQSPRDLVTIGPTAFHFCDQLETVTFSEALRHIGSDAFVNTKLTMVELPNGVESIGKSAFFLIDSLNYLYLPASVKTVDKNAFNAHNGRLTIESDIADLSGINKAAFAYTPLNQITILTSEDLLQTYSESGFTGISSIQKKGAGALTDKALPNALEQDQIKYEVVVDSFRASGSKVRAVGRLTDQEEVSIPATIEYNGRTMTVTEIGGNLFRNNKVVKKVSLPDTIEHIAERAFSDATSMEEISIPSVKTIGASAFNNTASLKEVVLPEGLTTVERSAFYNQKALKKVTLPSSLSTIGFFAFDLPADAVIDSYMMDLSNVSSYALSGHVLCDASVVDDYKKLFGKRVKSVTGVRNDLSEIDPM